MTFYSRMEWYLSGGSDSSTIHTWRHQRSQVSWINW